MIIACLVDESGGLEREAEERREKNALKAENARLRKAMEGLLPLVKKGKRPRKDCDCWECAAARRIRNRIAAAREAMK